MTILLSALCLIIAALTTSAQDARESLGPKDKPAQAKEPHPLTQMMGALNSSMRPELRGKHPRVFATEVEIAKLRERARTTHRDLWSRALRQVRALKKEPPAPPAQERRAQNEVGIGIAEAALAYKIEGDRKYLDAAKKYLEAAVSYDIWGYAYNKPNVDLAAGHLLYGMGWGYDLLYHDLTEAERATAIRLLQAEAGADLLLQPESRLHSDGRIGRGRIRALRRSRRRAGVGRPGARHL
jgi:hypothetical protein